MATLYEIDDDLKALHALLLEGGGDVSDEDVAATVDAWFAEIGDARNKKLDGYVALIREFIALAEIRKQEADRMAQRSQVASNAADRLRRRLQLYFAANGITTVETDRFRITLANNGGKLPLKFRDGFTIDDCPPEFQRVKMEPDTEKIRAALESGASLPFASLGERGSSIRIK